MTMPCEGEERLFLAPRKQNSETSRDLPNITLLCQLFLFFFSLFFSFFLFFHLLFFLPFFSFFLLGVGLGYLEDGNWARLRLDGWTGRMKGIGRTLGYGIGKGIRKGIEVETGMELSWEIGMINGLNIGVDNGLHRTDLGADNGLFGLISGWIITGIKGL